MRPSAAIDLVEKRDETLLDDFRQHLDRRWCTVELPADLPADMLANLGRIADFTARATWVKNLFEAGGIEALTSDGFASIEALTAAYKASGAQAAVIASSDAVYETEAVPAATALADAGCEILYLAGKPADAEKKAAYEGAGVTGFVHVGIDVVATLSDTLDRLGA